MNDFELPFFNIQRETLALRRAGCGCLCAASDIHVPARVEKRGNIDIQNHSALVPLFNLESGSLVIDVGGYVGDTAYALSQSGCSVYTFEPFLENYLALLWNTQDTDVVSYLAAVGNGEKVKFNYTFEDSDCGMLYVVEDPEGVPTVRLDDLSNTFPWSSAVNLLKIDCEGREIKVLEGAVKILTEYQPPMFIESYPDGLKRQGFSTEDLHAKIKELGYEIKNEEHGYTSTIDLICLPKGKT